MPLYEYHCRACDHRFERIVKFSDAPLKSCPQCGAEGVQQLISAPAVQFKGSGWYVTDYARKNSAGSSSASASNGASANATASPAGASAEAASTTTAAATDSSKGAADGGPKKQAAGKNTSKPSK